METILFILTFVFGTLRLLMFTKLSESRLIGILSLIFNKKRNKFINYLDVIIFYASLYYQVYFFGQLLNLI